MMVYTNWDSQFVCASYVYWKMGAYQNATPIENFQPSQIQYTVCCPIKAHSHQVKAKAKIFFDVCRLFFDLFCLSFDLFSLSLPPSPAVNRPMHGRFLTTLTLDH